MKRVHLDLPAPAKLNLMLHITGLREDGYHELQTIFQFIDLVDDIRLTLREDGQITRPDGPADVPVESDITVRAARALKQHCRVDTGVSIQIEKRIPMGAGLGGGSSDAATVLQGLNRLWDCGLDQDRLARIGLELGADVPVFVHGFAAFAEGVGERLTPVEIEQCWYLVITPQVHVSTAEIFAEPRLTRDSPTLKICDLFGGAGADWDNVCTPVVLDRYPEIGRALDKLAEYAPSKMSGTGASVFAAFEDEAQARRVMETIRDAETDWKCFVVRGLNRSPVLDEIEV